MFLQLRDNVVVGTGNQFIVNRIATVNKENTQ